MPRRSLEAITKQRDLVLSIVIDAGGAIDREQVRAEYKRRVGKAASYNTVSARLEELVAQGRLRRPFDNRRPVNYEVVNDGGENRSPAGELGNSKPRTTQSAEATTGIPLSQEARHEQQLIRRPRSERKPTGYEVGFLNEYRPGTTWYIDDAERVRLYELGRTTYMDQPAGTFARDIMQRLVIDLSWGSSRLEGLKYSRIDTEEILNGERTTIGASDQERQLILNHKAAIEFLVGNASEIAYNRRTVVGLHTLLSENLLDNRREEGSLRTRAVIIGTSVYTPTAIPQLIEERFETLLEKAEAIPDPIEQAFFVMVHLPYLQPFIDVNKRTSRLAANISLVRANLCPLSFVDVPEPVYTEGILGIYELRDITLLREVFTWAYERSCAQFKVLREAMGEPDPIRLNYRSQLRELVRFVVQELTLPTEEELKTRAREAAIPSLDRDAFVAEAVKDLLALRVDILVRYGLRESEFNSWKEALAKL